MQRHDAFSRLDDEVLIRIAELLPFEDRCALISLAAQPSVWVGHSCDLANPVFLRQLFLEAVTRLTASSCLKFHTADCNARCSMSDEPHVLGTVCRVKLPCLARRFAALAALDTRLWRTVVLNGTKAYLRSSGVPAVRWVAARAHQLDAAHLIGFEVLC